MWSACVAVQGPLTGILRARLEAVLVEKVLLLFGCGRAIVWSTAEQSWRMLSVLNSRDPFFKPGHAAACLEQRALAAGRARWRGPKAARGDAGCPSRAAGRAPRHRRDHAYTTARARPARRLLAHTSLPKFTGRLVPDGLSAGATPQLPRVSRLALRLLPPENFGRPHSTKMGSHARR